MSRNLSINVEFLTRVEGHGHIVLDVKEGILTACQLQIVEAPRFFEAMLQGHSIFEAQHITSRICGICACGHSLASIQAAEAAIGFTPSSQTMQLRNLLLQMELIDSHVLHFYLLVLPDLFGVKSFMGLMKDHADTVRRALRMKKACNDVCDMLVGRHVHPISCVVGGFTMLPGARELKAIRRHLLQICDDLVPSVELASTLSFPHFQRDTEYVGLVADNQAYPLLAGDIGSTDGIRKPKEEYHTIIDEFLVPYSSAKHARLSRNSYMVGAQSRFNLNYSKLHPKAKEAAAAIGLKPHCTNPYLNTAAQVVECVHCIEEAITIVEHLLDQGIDQSEAVTAGVTKNQAIPVRAGCGVGAVEVPRGLLIHHYRIDEKGTIIEADCVIPTAQNLQNIEDDMRKLAPELLDSSDREITLALEMLVRAYDPCISCSTHFLEVEIVR